MQVALRQGYMNGKEIIVRSWERAVNSHVQGENKKQEKDQEKPRNHRALGLDLNVGGFVPLSSDERTLDRSE